MQRTARRFDGVHNAEGRRGAHSPNYNQLGNGIPFTTSLRPGAGREMH